MLRLQENILTHRTHRYRMVYWPKAMSVNLADEEIGPHLIANDVFVFQGGGRLIFPHPDRPRRPSRGGIQVGPQEVLEWLDWPRNHARFGPYYGQRLWKIVYHKDNPKQVGVASTEAGLWWTK